MGYVDGLNAYSGYFIPRVFDPTGKNQTEGDYAEITLKIQTGDQSGNFGAAKPNPSGGLCTLCNDNKCYKLDPIKVDPKVVWIAKNFDIKYTDRNGVSKIY